MAPVSISALYIDLIDCGSSAVLAFELKVVLQSHSPFVTPKQL